jgi:mono/diheme cytochrome c family protein
VDKRETTAQFVRTPAYSHARIKARGKKDRIFRLKGILFVIALVTGPGIARAQKSEQKPAERQPSTASGKETFLKYCASCHGEDAKGNGPAAIALKPPPADLTTLSKRYNGKFPAGHVSALLKFGRNLAAHGSLDMPVWGSRFKTLDPVRDPTGQQHIDDVVAYIRSLQAK